MREQQRMRRWLRAEQGSQSLEAAGAALAAALIVLALLAGARGVLGPAVAQAFECAAAVLVGGGGDCGGVAGQTAQAQPANTSTPGQAPQQESCGALCQVGDFFKTGGAVLWESVKGLGTLALDGFKAATGDQAARDKFAAAWDAIRNDPIGAARAIWDGIADPVMEDLRAGRPGAAAGRITAEIGSVFIGPKSIDKLSKLNKVDDTVRGADRLSDTRRTINGMPCVGAAPAGKGPGLAKPLSNPCLEAGNQLKDRAKNVRQRYAAFDQDLATGGRNVATTKVDIDGRISETWDSINGSAPISGTVPPPSNRLFKTRFAGVNRDYDTEVKVLEEVAHRLGVSKPGRYEEFTGRIDLYSERRPCLSCGGSINNPDGVIQQFREMFPNIELNVYHSQKGNIDEVVLFNR